MKDKKKIMNCYAEGMGINSICRVFKVGINSVQSWIKAEGEKFIQPDIKEEKFVSCHEMWTFIEKKRQKAWIWLCYSKMTKKDIERFNLRMRNENAFSSTSTKND